MVKLIIFDFSGTLAHCEAKDYREMLGKLRDFNLPVDEAKAAKLEEKMPEYFSEAANWEELTNRVIQKLGLVLEADRREALAVFLEKKLGCKLFADAHDILALPQKKAILTLSRKFVVESVPELRNFEIFSPEITGAKKPNPKAFLAVLKKMRIAPRDALMVGDSLEVDINPAKAAGIKAILVDREGKIDDNSIVKIASLKELKKFL